MTALKATTSAFAALLFACAGTVSAQIKWDMPTAYPDSNFHTKNIRQFADEVAKGTGGKLQITVHPSNSLIKHPEIKRAVQTGQVPIGELLLSLLANESAVFAFDSNPFLAPTSAQQRTLWAAARPLVTQRFDGQGIMLLYSVPWPPSAIHTKKEMNGLADFKGVKLRSFSAVTSRFAELAGATPVMVNASEVPQAFKTGMIDAQINSPAGGVDTQTWDFTTHTYDAQVIAPHNAVIVGKAAWSRLDATTQEVVRKAAAAAETRGWEAREKENEENIAMLASKGIKVVKPGPALAAEFAEIGRRMTDDWAKRGGAEAEAILKAYKQ